MPRSMMVPHEIPRFLGQVTWKGGVSYLHPDAKQRVLRDADSTTDLRATEELEEGIKLLMGRDSEADEDKPLVGTQA